MEITSQNILDIDFGKVFRKMALEEENTEDFSPAEIRLFEDQGNIDINKSLADLLPKTLAEVFFRTDSSKILWILRCIRNSSGNYLHELCAYLKDVSSVKRGGLNIYKRVGWDIHVLYSYQLVTDNFAKNITTTIPGAPRDFSLYHEIYTKLPEEALFVLKIATFLHDIGVVDGVRDHEFKGIRWVEARYQELGISPQMLHDHNVLLSENDIMNLLKIIVGNHQMMNQIGSEISDFWVHEKIEDAKKQLGYSDKATAFFEKYIADIMFLLSAADLMAVNDTLLTKEKTSETLESYTYFSELLKRGFYKRDAAKYGIQRYRSLLPDVKKSELSDKLFNSVVEKLGYNAGEVSAFLYNVKQLSYAMTVVKPQSDFTVGIKLMCILFELAKKHHLQPLCTRVKFHPDINYMFVGEYLQKEADVISCINIFDIEVKDGDIYINTEESK